MFHFVDLNLMASDFATFAASMGYACTRKIATLPRTFAWSPFFSLRGDIRSRKDQTPDTLYEEKDALAQHDAIVECELEESISMPISHSLKRKRQNDDQEVSLEAGYPHNLSLIYPPKKRSRTPSSEKEAEEVGHAQCVDAVTAIIQEPCHVVDIIPPISLEPLFPETKEPIQKSPSLREETIKPPRSSRSFSLKRRTVASEAFSAFAGPDTPLSKVTPSKSSKPAWLVGPNESISIVDDRQDEHITSNKLEGHVLEAAKVSESTFKHVTGEEEEEVTLELKGVKLFAKRGNQPFSDGLVGHVKLLSNKATLDQRLLFRREPLWQVSMNIRVHPSIRSTFDAEENVLRIIMTEAIEREDAVSRERQRQVVVYALKPSRSCSKQDFADFADALMKASGFQEKP